MSDFHNNKRPFDLAASLGEQQKLRDERKRSKDGYQGFDKNTPPKLQFHKRPLVSVNRDPPASLRLKIMTYNTLAQSLIRRSLFPTSGDALKWATRSQVLASELKYYDADIMCLQEVDEVQFESYWKGKLKELGYDFKFERAYTKRHGIVIAFKPELLTNTYSRVINYDREDAGFLSSQTITDNLGLVVCLGFTKTAREKYPGLKSGIVIATTHLFWHPMGTYERARQSFILMLRTIQFAMMVGGSPDSFYHFMAGDFNTQPFDFPYLAMTSSKPLSRQFGEAEAVLAKSLGSVVNAEEGEEEEVDARSNLPSGPTEDQRETIDELRGLYDLMPANAISLYSIGYELVDPANSGIDNTAHEPYFSNWAHTWRGLLDYIFVLAPRIHQARPDVRERLAADQGVKLISLLRLPRKEEMGPEPSGQPRIGQYPSDHLCMIAEVELN